MTERRKITYRLYPRPQQRERMEELLGLHQQLYNAALEERISAYQIAGISIGFADQCKSLTEIRRDCPEFGAVNASSQQRTLRKLNLAYSAFFRRVQAGQTPGFPRFKPLSRYPGWGYKKHGDGWKFTPDANWKHGTLHLSGVGFMKARSDSSRQGDIVTCEIMHKAGRWYLSLTVEAKQFTRESTATRAMGMDWGVSHLLSIVESDNTIRVIENPRWYQTHKADELELEQARDRKKRGSNRRRKALQKAGAFKSKVSRKRKDFHHKLSAELANDYALIATEKLKIKNMTRSAKGTAEKPGKNVPQKAGLNREILDTAPAQLLSYTSYKAVEAGNLYMEAPTRSLKPSQRCPACWNVKKKTLSQRIHECECGHVEPRDTASARVNLIWAQSELTGREPSRDRGEIL